VAQIQNSQANAGQQINMQTKGKSAMASLNPKAAKKQQKKRKAIPDTDGSSSFRDSDISS